MSTYTSKSTDLQNIRYEQKSFQEVNLPFESIGEEQDYVTGEELYNALTSDEVSSAMHDYSISDSRNHQDETFAFMATTRSHAHLWKSAYIRAEEDVKIIQDDEWVDEEYSHLRLEVAAPDKKAMEALEQDLGVLEQGLENYYSDAETDASASDRWIRTVD